MCKLETSQSSRRGSTPPMAVRSQAWDLGRGGVGQGRAGWAPSRVPERGWYGVWLGPLHGLSLNQVSMCAQGGKLHLPIAIPLRGGGVKDRLWSRGRKLGMNRKPSQSKKLGLFVSLRAEVGGCWGKVPVAATIAAPATKPGNREKLSIDRRPLTAAGWL